MKLAETSTAMQSVISTSPGYEATLMFGGKELEFKEPVSKKDKVSTESSQDLKTIPLNEFVAFELSLVPEVEAVYTAKAENVFYVWVVVNESDEAVRNKIYAREQAIIDEFDKKDFDFTILFRRGKSLREVISDPSLVQAFLR